MVIGILVNKWDLLEVRLGRIEARVIYIILVSTRSLALVLIFVM